MAVKKANPMTTRTGKPRLGPLNLEQLNTMLEKTSKKKEKSKIINRIRTLESRKVVKQYLKIYAGLAQQVEQRTCNAKVNSSIPLSSTSFTKKA